MPNASDGTPRQFGAVINGRSVSQLFTQIKDGHSSALIAKRYLRLGPNTVIVRYPDHTTASVNFIYSPPPTTISLPGSSEDTGFTSDYVPIHTRIVLNDGSSPSDYVIKVDKTSYPAPSTVGLTGFHVLAFDRSDGTKKVDIAVSTPPVIPPPAGGLLAQISSQISSNCTAEWGCVVIVSSLQTIGATNCPNSVYECSSLQGAADPGYSIWQMGGSDRINFVNGTNSVNTYSLITTVGQGGSSWRAPLQGNERLACNAGSDCLHDGAAPNIWTGNGDISGALVLDSNNAYTFTHVERPTFSLPPSKNAGDTNTITVNGQSYSATLPAGSSGGFHVVVLDTSYLGLSLNATFPITFGGLNSMISNLYAYYPNTDNYLVFITSMGDLGHSGLQGEWLQLGAALKLIGGSYHLFSQLDSSDDYSLIGNPPATADQGMGSSYLSRVAEASSIVTRAQTTGAQNFPSSIRGVLGQDSRGYYRPTISNLTSTFADQATALLDRMALQDPIDWPFTPASSSCSNNSTDTGRGNAYQAMSYRLTVTAAIPDGNPDIRTLYTNYEPDTFSSYESTVNGLTFDDLQSWLKQYEPTNTELSKFTTDDFCRAQAQVVSELTFVVSVQTYMKSLQDTMTASSNSLQTEIDVVYNDLAQQLQVDPSSSSSTFADIMGAVSGVLSIASYTTPEAPEVALGLDAASVAISYGMSLSNNEAGAPIVADQLRSTLANLKQDTQNQYISSSEVVGNLFTLILEDWGRLSTLGLALANNPQPKIKWDTNTQNRYVNATYKAMTIEYVKAFFGSLYQIYSWPQLVSGGEPIKNYENVCNYYGVSNGDCKLGQYFDGSDWLNVRSGPDGTAPGNGEDGNYWDVYLIAGNASSWGDDSCYQGVCDCTQKVSGSYPFDAVMKPIFTPLDPVSDPGQPNAPQTQNLGVYAPWFFTKTSIPAATLQHTGCTGDNDSSLH